MKADYKRQTLIFNPEEDNSLMVSVVGLGNIGSHTAINLARLGIKGISLWDFDKVEIHNLTSQDYDQDDLGKAKVSCMASKIKKINPDVKVFGETNRFIGTRGVGPSDILVIAIDTMDGRKEIAKNMEFCKIKPALIIDARVGGEQLEVYCCKDTKEWKKTFVDNPSQDLCGGRFICYTSVIVGGIITSIVKKFLKKQRIEKSLIMHLGSMDVMKNIVW